ncbi:MULTISPECIES: 1-deoxy-D-xylulose-5-phosphate synthase [unclassified Streptomyces]|uniref:1-deoxy-D-xylulose-5-phosphate synthase n=1 Tax=unclassified Streptomyces TaxID=2593676 RepID=UPI001CC014F9|nr:MULTISPECIES: 1-deoxy-D-xylulose-5-phosphate synthase [unclassified Streptomyces]WPO70792.1 1-deoxy-D-xylulose-5-phosphate synthase [Streptomyces sp. KN37]
MNPSVEDITHIAAVPEATPDLLDFADPADLRALSPQDVRRLVPRIRRLLIDTVTRTGGHLGPNLGVVELSIALHRVFDSPRDRILWDTGHQTYVHKLLTGRGRDFATLRSTGGLSGYPSRAESDHDVIENSHASTALSWADGLARAHALRGLDDRAVVAVVGDGALTGGMAWEALNNIASADRPVIVVLNDNGRSYAPTVGALAVHLAELRAPGVPKSFFEGLGMGYLGPVDGHDVTALENVLRRAAGTGRPVVVHCVTEKGRGHAPALADDAERFHAVRARPRGDGAGSGGTGSGAGNGSGTGSGTDTGNGGAALSWTSVFGRELAEIGADRPDIVALTAAMPGPTGLTEFAARFPDRTVDVGIAEQHAVTAAAGLALGGMHPVVALYATFLNRAFDQLLLDTALHRAPVTLVLDRAGVTGDDGPSHHGMWDMSLLQLVPGLRLAAPRDAATLRRALREAVAVDDGPTAVRFPKGRTGEDVPAIDTIGGLDVLRRDPEAELLLVSVGAMAQTCLEAADLLAGHGHGVTVVDPRWVKPVPQALVELAATYRLVATVEDNGRAGGVGAAVTQALADAEVPTPVRNFGLPQSFLDHGSRADVLERCGLTGGHVAGALADTLVGRARRQPANAQPMARRPS